MKKPSLTALAAVLALSSPVLAEQLTPERIFADPSLSGPTAKGVALSPDGKRVTYLKSKPEAANVQDLWAADVKGGEPYRLIDSAALSSGNKELSEAEKARRERARVQARGIVEYSWDKQGRFILVPLDGDLYLDSVADGKVTRLTETPGDEVDAKVSPKGGYVSYVRDQNLYIKPITGGAETALTTEGKDALSFGVAEFIAQEELDRFTGYWWSPDEARIVYTRVDESGVDIVPRADIGPGGATVVNQRYPRAGRPNAVVDLFVRDLASGKAIQLDLGAKKDIYVARVAWAQDGKTVYVERLSRDQKTLDLLAFDAATGKSRVVLTETDPHFLELNNDFKPLKDGTFLWGSERDGNQHLYRYAADGKLLAQITKGDWPVGGVEGVDEDRKVVIFGASMDSPLERRIYEVSYAKPGTPKALTPGGGWWTAKVADTGGAFAASYNDPKTPPPDRALFGRRQAGALDRGKQAGRGASLLALRGEPADAGVRNAQGRRRPDDVLRDPQADEFRPGQEVSGHRLGLWRPARPAGQQDLAEPVGAHLSRSRLCDLQAGQSRQRQSLGRLQARPGPPHGHGRGRRPAARRQVPGQPSLRRRQQAGRDGLVLRRLHDPDADDGAGHAVQGRRGGRSAHPMGSL
jgi:dipeptidyl-peptidase-4